MPSDTFCLHRHCSRPLKINTAKFETNETAFAYVRDPGYARNIGRMEWNVASGKPMLLEW
jgi:hypothetical protein